MAAAMDQLPPIPEEARRHFVRGTALFKDAKSPDDYKQVVDEFTQAARLAPWWPDARYNYALALEAAGHYDKAIAALKLYLLFKLPEADARASQDKIYILEAKKEKAAKAKEESSAQETAAEERKKRIESSPDFSGVWKDPSDITCWTYKFVVVESRIVIRESCPGMAEQILGWATLSGRNFAGRVNTAPLPNGGHHPPGEIDGRIGDDNKVIHMTLGTHQSTYVREQ